MSNAQQQQMVTAPTNGALSNLRSALAGAHKSFEAALPATVARYLTPERLTKITLAAIGRSEILLQCTPQSILRSVMDAASLGLDPSGGAMGHAYMVPFRNKKLGGRWEAQLIVGYRGYIELARRSGEVTSVHSHLVYRRDDFFVEQGTERKISHRPTMSEDRGDIVAVYCLADLRSGARQQEYMTIGDVEKIRLRSRARDNGPWKTDYGEMVRKTVIRRAAKYWPLSAELARAFDIDDHAENDDRPSPTVDVVDIAALPPEPGRYEFSDDEPVKPDPVPEDAKPKAKPKAAKKAAKKAEAEPPPAMSSTGEDFLGAVASCASSAEIDAVLGHVNELPDGEQVIVTKALQAKASELKARAEGKAEPGADG